MIQQIGVVCQDRISYGFLEGIRRRLRCDARLIEPTTGALGKSTTMTRRQATLAARILRHNGAQLIIRFTDADRNRWQDIKRQEQAIFPDEVKSIVVCGVAVENTEQWLGLDRTYIEQRLGVVNAVKLTSAELTGAVKNSIQRGRSPDEPVSEMTARFVAELPSDVFRKWLEKDDSLRAFYDECRKAALRETCPVPNELD